MPTACEHSDSVRGALTTTSASDRCGQVLALRCAASTTSISRATSASPRKRMRRVPSSHRGRCSSQSGSSPAVYCLAMSAAAATAAAACSGEAVGPCWVEWCQILHVTMFHFTLLEQKLQQALQWIGRFTLPRCIHAEYMSTVGVKRLQCTLGGCPCVGTAFSLGSGAHCFAVCTMAAGASKAGWTSLSMSAKRMTGLPAAAAKSATSTAACCTLEHEQ
jgi:hypothetical protein